MTLHEKVAAIYEAFGRGDIEFILSHVADDVLWDSGSEVQGAPWLKARKGIDEVKKFFEATQELEFHQFQPKDILTGDNVAVGVLDIEATVRKTGRRIKEVDEVHVFRFNDEGKIAFFRHGVDSYAHELAWLGDSRSQAA